MTREQKIVRWIEIVLFCTGSGLRLVYSSGAPEWTDWFGDVAFGLFFEIPGVALLFAPKRASTWLYPKEDPTEWTVVDWVYFYTAAIVFLVFGTVFLFVSIYGIIMGCHLHGTCPGLWG